MALVVEDGSNVAGANSYTTAAEFVSFNTDRGNTVLAEADTSEIEAALVKATDYMTQKFRLLWKGARANADQRLDWPRRGVDVPDFFDPFFRELSNVPLSFQDTLFIAENAVPYEVKVAQILIANATFDASGLSSGVLQASLGRVTKREKLGELEVEYFNAEDGSSRSTIIYWDAERSIEPFILYQNKFGGQLVRN
jgi:hypothetical protein